MVGDIDPFISFLGASLPHDNMIIIILVIPDLVTLYQYNGQGIEMDEIEVGALGPGKTLTAAGTEMLKSLI